MVDKIIRLMVNPGLEVGHGDVVVIPHQVVGNTPSVSPPQGSDGGNGAGGWNTNEGAGGGGGLRLGQMAQHPNPEAQVRQSRSHIKY